MGSRMFIAVQCCECWMMQVKQQKKSGNKWTCVVCNQKQSVRKVFAKGYMATDLRQFVQSFNMSQSQKPQTLSHQLEEEQQQDKTKDTICVGDGHESRIGTEMPNKKPKLSINGVHTGDGEGEEYGSGERDSTICWPSMTKAVVSKWSKYLSEDDMEPETCQRAKVNSGSKGHTFITQDDEDVEQKRACPPTMAMGMLKQNNYTQNDITPRSYQEKVAKAALKWDNYLTEDGDGQQRRQWPTMAMGPSKEKNYLTPDDIEPRKTCQKKVAKAALQWNDYMTEAGEQGTRCPTKVGKSASKWNSYLTQEEEDELQLVSWKQFRTDHLGK